MVVNFHHVVAVVRIPRASSADVCARSSSLRKKRSLILHYDGDARETLTAA
jgi:hypothetical protein